MQNTAQKLHKLSRKDNNLDLISDDNILVLKEQIKRLQNNNQKLENHNKELQQKYNNKSFEAEYYKQLYFGIRSEKAKYLKSNHLSNQPVFDFLQEEFDKREKEQEEELAKQVSILKEKQKLANDLIKQKTPKKKRGRKSLKLQHPDLEVEERVIDIAESQKICSCGSCLTVIGSETSSTLEYIPATFKIIDHKRLKYGCKSCEENIVIAPKANKAFDKSSCGTSFLSHILVSKYKDHLPFYRQSKILKRYGVKIPDKLLDSWFFRASSELSPLLMALKDEILKDNYIYCDETSCTQLDKKQTSQPYLWLYQSHNSKLRYYHYALSRSGTHAELLLSGYKGYVQTDGYSGYNFLDKQAGVIRLGCMAHARRKFADILKVSKNKSNVAYICYTMINRLYLIEQKAKLDKLSSQDLYKKRQKESALILLELKEFAEDQIRTIMRDSPLYKALNYLLNQYNHLSNYLLSGDLRIDNNLCENGIRPFALGRKNWLFVGDERGGTASATIYSLIESTSLHDLNPEKYLTYLFDNISKTSKKDLVNLLPHKVDKTLINNYQHQY